LYQFGGFARNDWRPLGIGFGLGSILPLGALVLDVFMSVTSFLLDGPARPWWCFTEQRKRQYGRLQVVGIHSALSGARPSPEVLRT
jgi:hypothetical protein